MFLLFCIYFTILFVCFRKESEELGTKEKNSRALWGMKEACYMNKEIVRDSHLLDIQI